MKVKLLKKLHKRYDWYFNQSGFPVLIDHLFKSVTIYSPKYCCGLSRISIKDLEDINRKEFTLVCMKEELLKKYGWTLSRKQYKKANLILKLKRIK